jgi:hypothetical protein
MSLYEVEVAWQVYTRALDPIIGYQAFNGQVEFIK